MAEIEVIQNVWCSWCFEKGVQYLLERKYLGRNLYRCALCCNDTNCCTMCSDGMSRHTTDGADKLCMRCDKTIKEWGEYPNFVEQHGPCSWCFNNTIHLLVKYNYVRRSIYLCTDCKHRTLRCRSCEKAFARGSVGYDDEYCIVCSGKVPSWSDPQINRSLVSRQGWCSWCVSNTKHIIEQVNSMRRDVLSCTECDGRTLPCFTCTIAMARGGVGWDDDSCLCCSQHKNILQRLGHGLWGKTSDATAAKSIQLLDAWEALHKEKQETNEKYTNPEFVRGELSRDSEFRKLAYKAGMIRPFLLLVGMTPQLRNQVSCFMGWSIFTEEYFGDSHAESWDILNRGGQGMISRANSVMQKLNPLAKSCTYYELLYRVIEAVFKLCPLPSLSHKDAFRASNLTTDHGTAETPTQETRDKKESSKGGTAIHTDTNTDLQDAVTQSAQNQDTSKEATKTKINLGTSQSNVGESFKNSLLIAQLEEYLMAQVHSQQRKTMTKAQRESEDQRTQDDQSSGVQAAVELIQTKAGLTNRAAISYGINVARSVFQVPGKWGLTLMSMQAIQIAVPTTAIFMAPAIAAIVGVVNLLWSGLNLALGPSLWCLYGPLVLMTNQRIVLSLQDLQVEKFY